MTLKSKIDLLRAHLEKCLLCPRQCGVNRLRGELGFCRAGSRLRVSSYCIHTGEEPPISGTRGSGTIFFTHCNMRCVYCQNYPISQLGYGNDIEIQGLATIMLELQSRGAHNINLVTPTHFLPQIAEALLSARKNGLVLPVIYNSSGYETVETVGMLEDIAQIYLVDMRYSRGQSAGEYSNAPDYPRHNRLAVEAMFKQVGPLRLREGLAIEGIVIRHLILPSLLDETQDILEFVSRRISKEVPVSLMSQYFPANRAHSYTELNRKITRPEYERAMSLLRYYGLYEGWAQDPNSSTLPVV